MRDISELQPATFESVWAALQETDRVLSEKIAETDRVLSEKFAETDRQIKEISKSIGNHSDEYAEIRRILNETSKLVGGVANSNGDVAESYFVNSFANHLHFAGQEYDSHAPNVVKSIKKLNLKDQYDLVTCKK